MPRYELNLLDYLRILRRRKYVIISTFVVFVGVSFYYSSQKIPIYEASTTIKIEERKTVAGLLTEMIVFSPGDIMETLTKTIKGFPTMKIVAYKMKLINEKTPDSEIDEVVSELQSKIDAERIGQTNIVRISATSTNPKEAMDLANYTAEATIEQNLAEKNKQVRTTRQFLEDQINVLEDKIRIAETKLRLYGGEAKITAVEELDKKLVELKIQLATLLQKYTEKHPAIISLKEQISEIENQLKGVSGKDLEYVRLRRDLEANRKTYTMLREKLEEARITEAEKVSDISVVDPALMPTSPTDQGTARSLVLGGLLGLIIGMALAFVAENLDTSIGTIEDVENILKLPVLGTIPAVIYGEAGRRDRRRSSIRRLEILLKRRFWRGKVSEEEKKYVRLIAHHDPKSPVAEYIRNIKTNIKFSDTRKAILITSAGPQEGKTSLLINLALVCAQDGLRTIIVSADLRRPNIAETFGLKESPGLNEVVTGTATLKDALRGISDMIIGEMSLEDVLKDPGLGFLWILTAGPIPLNPIDILNAKEFDTLIETLKKEFDVILLDSPPVLLVTDANILSTKTDGVVICYEFGRTSRQALQRAKSQLDAAKANILGVVLNHISPQTQIAEPYPYAHKYYGTEKRPDAFRKK